jgi:hypothetical protein
MMQAGDARAKKEVGRQADDPLDHPLLHQLAPDVGLRIAAKETPWGRITAALPLLLSDLRMCSRKA